MADAYGTLNAHCVEALDALCIAVECCEVPRQVDHHVAGFAFTQAWLVMYLRLAPAMLVALTGRREIVERLERMIGAPMRIAQNQPRDLLHLGNTGIEARLLARRVRGAAR